ncbi:hypothetical protein PIB30_089652 [Stylosanthes scabra]|uniref:Uncharacterized protein n=1 Tax=Stylosanthes scabra TaxID=79078 RepID=A0ABU6QWH3_9FABA|nr:hypothetical protein [Stylosanthes scabra]
MAHDNFRQLRQRQLSLNPRVEVKQNATKNKPKQSSWKTAVAELLGTAAQQLHNDITTRWWRLPCSLCSMTARGPSAAATVAPAITAMERRRGTTAM